MLRFRITQPEGMPVQTYTAPPAPISCFPPSQAPPPIWSMPKISEHYRESTKRQKASENYPTGSSVESQQRKHKLARLRTWKRRTSATADEADSDTAGLRAREGSPSLRASSRMFCEGF